jgi:competence transcription factor ComK
MLKIIDLYKSCNNSETFTDISMDCVWVFRASMSDIKTTFQNSQEVTAVLETQSNRLSYLNLNSVNQLIFVMVKCGALFEVRTEFLNNI